MKSFMGSQIVTNILLAAVAIVGSLMAYIFDDHKKMPWHGTVGIELTELKGEVKAAHKDIERIMERTCREHGAQPE